MKLTFWNGLLLFLLVGCGTGGLEARLADTFVFGADPAAGTVEASSVAGGGPVNQESGKRVLVPGADLVVEASEFVFLPGNILRLELTFKNVSSCAFSELNFGRGADSRAVVDSVEPEVSSVGLGDGVLVPGEVTGTLQFGVIHTGKPFTYEIEAEALVTCGEGPKADLRVDITKRSGDPVAQGKDVEYFVNVRNLGPEPATGVKLTVGFPFTLTSASEGCAGNGGLTCTVGTIPVDESKGVTIIGEANEEGTFTVTAQASANEADPNASNNSDTEETTVDVPAEVCTDPVSIPDSALEKAIRNDDELQKPTGDLTCADLARLTELSADIEFGDEDSPEPIRSLEGLQFAVNLTTVTLNGNDINNIDPLSGLTRLTKLKLNSNQISDLGPLSGLTGLETLTLYSNNIVDLTPLGGLTSLTDLQLGDNSISDVGPLRGLTKLTILDLYFNEIESIGALVANEGLGDGEDFIDLRSNCLTAEAIEDAATIEARSPDNDVTFTSQGGEQCGP